MNFEPSVSEHISNSQIPWRVLRVKTGREFEVTNSIAELGYETYCPRVISASKVRFGPLAMRQEAVRAMYQGWVLARWLPDSRLDRLRRRGLLYHTPILGAVSEAQVQFVRVMELEVAMMSARKVKIQPGDFGTIMIGILKGEPIQVLQVRKQKLMVKLMRNERAREFEIGADCVTVTA